MNAISSPLFHRVLKPRRPTGQPSPTMIFLHGRGADEEDLPGLAGYLDERLLCISVRAPFPFSQGGGYTWYDSGEKGEPEPLMFRSSCGKLSQFMDEVLLQYPADPANIFLLGFSMGTVMSYSIALTRPEIVRGVAANSGYIPENTHLVFQWKRLGTVSFCISHGTYDQVIPVEYGRRSRDLLEQNNATVRYREYPMAHEISEASISEIASWLDSRLAQTQEAGHARP